MKNIAKKVLVIVTKIIFAIAMASTVIAALMMFGSLFRSQISFSDAFKMLGVSILVWVCFVVLTKLQKKNRI